MRQLKAAIAAVILINLLLAGTIMRMTHSDFNINSTNCVRN
jgi:hypothetical protein